MAEAADTVVILSSELIAKIAEQYFNKYMFKQQVAIVDLKPTETGYMFSIAFVDSKKKETVTYDIYDSLPGMQPVSTGRSVEIPVRGDNGRFVKKG